MPPGQQVKVHKSASFVDILKVCKFTSFCDRKGYTAIIFPYQKNTKYIFVYIPILPRFKNAVHVHGTQKLHVSNSQC